VNTPVVLTNTLTKANLGQAFHFVFQPFVVLALAALVSLAFVVLSVVFLHHWRTHAIDRSMVRRVTAIYFSGGFLFLAGFIISAIRLIR
jgi:hypothetical protein